MAKRKETQSRQLGDEVTTPSAVKLYRNGLIDLFFSREEYGERLDIFLSRATRSIEVVAVTFRLASDKGDLHGMLKEKLEQIPDFRVRVSLLEPSSAAVDVLATELAVRPDALRAELTDSLTALAVLREKLTVDAKERFHLLTHQTLPFGSGYMLDATPISGLIHVETKLHGASGKEIFAYRLVAPSNFYSQNYASWNRLLDQSAILEGEKFSRTLQTVSMA